MSQNKNDFPDNSFHINGKTQKTPERNDHFKLMISFVILGMGPLFPYNSLISCVDFFKSIHPNDDVISQIAATSLLSLLITTSILTYILSPSGNTKTNVNFFSKMCSIQSPQKRIIMGFAIEFIIFIILAFIPAPSVFTINFIAFCVGMADASCQSGLFEWAASINPQITVAVNFGISLAGFGVNLLKMVTRAVFPNSIRMDAGLFFVCNAFLVLGCLASMYNAQAIIANSNAKSNRNTNHSIAVMAINVHNPDVETPNESSPVIQISTSDDQYISNIKNSPNSLSYVSLYWRTLQIIWKPFTANFVTFFVTLSLFPGPVTNILSNMDSSVHFGTWLPIVLITSYNICDGIGRFALSDFRSFSASFTSNEASSQLIAPSSLSEKILFQTLIKTNNSNGLSHGDDDENFIIHLPYFDSMALYPSFLRILFFPIIFACIKANDFFLFSQDLGRLFIVAIFGLSNGFIASASFMAGPTLVPPGMINYDLHRDAASLLLLLACFGGLTVGAYFALVVDKFIIS